jgi:predicted transcriptional regulator
MVEKSVRSLILDKVKESPGLHFREIQRVSGCATGQLQYHLYQLELAGQIYQKKDGKKVRFFPNEGPSFRERVILFSIRNKARSRIIFDLLASGHIQKNKLLKTRKSRAAETLEAYSDLINEGIIIDENGQVSLKNRKEIIAVLKKYRESFIDSLSTNLISLIR